MDEIIGLEGFLLSLTYAGGIIYIRQQLLKEYKHLTVKSYIKAQQLRKIIIPKTDVSLFFTQLKNKKK